MKKKLFFAILILVISGLTKVRSQCTPNANCDTMYCPKVLPNGDINQFYDQTITVKVPTTFIISGQSATIDSVKVISVTGNPSSFLYQLNPANHFTAGQRGCIRIYGTPTSSDTGKYILKINLKIFGKMYSIPQTVDTNIVLPLRILDATAINITQKISEDFAVFQNIPNPFTSKTEIDYTSPQVDNIEFSVYNIVGEMVYSEKDRATTGANKIMFESGSLPSGIYFYKLSNSARTSTHRMIISN